MPLAIAPRLLATADSIFDTMNVAAQRLRDAGHDVISLGQGLPPFGPPPEALDAFHEALGDPAMHRYSLVAGLTPLREALSAQLSREAAVDATADEIVVTAGGNQAVLLALITLVAPGDEVLLPSPYFTNHEGAVRAAGAVPVDVPTDPGAGFRLHWGLLEPHVTPRTRAVVICHPSNPTGGRIAEADLRELVAACARRGLALVSDETYMHFTGDDGHAHVSAASCAGWRDAVVLVSSCSKNWGVPGWRVGYLAAAAPVIEQALKAHDTMVICASVPAQAALVPAVRDDWHHARHGRAHLAEARRIVARHVAASPRLTWTPTDGAFFAFLRVDGVGDAHALALRLLETAHVVTIPGSSFGRAGEGHLRISYGAVSHEALDQGLTRIARVLDAV